MHLRTATFLLLLFLNVAFGEQKQDNIDWQQASDSVFARAKKEGRLLPACRKTSKSRMMRVSWIFIPA